MDSSTIGGDVLLDGAKIRRGNGTIRAALALDRVRIDGALRLTHAVGDVNDNPYMRCFGSVWLNRVRVLGSVDFQGAFLDDAKGGIALYADGAYIGGRLTFGQTTGHGARFLSRGCIWLQDMHVEGDVSLTSMRVYSPSPICEYIVETKEIRSICAHGLKADGSIRIHHNKIDGYVDLSDAQCSTLDDAHSGYRGIRSLELDGLRYSRLENPGISPTPDSDDAGGKSILTSRLNWLNRNRGYIAEGRGTDADRSDRYLPQPYLQLAKVLATQGYDRQARFVLLEKAKAELRSKSFDHTAFGAGTSGKIVRAIKKLANWIARPFVRFGKGVFVHLFGYGLLPERALISVVAAILVGWGFVSLMVAQGALVVSQQPVSQTIQGDQIGVVVESDKPFKAQLNCGTTIRPLLYAIDVFVPLIDLGEAAKCEIGAVESSTAGQAPSRESDSDSRAKARKTIELRDIEFAAYRYVKALFEVIGWIFVSLAIVTFSGVMRERLRGN